MAEGIVHEQGVPPVPDKQTVTGLPLVRQVVSGGREPDGQKSPAVRQGVSCLPPASDALRPIFRRIVSLRSSISPSGSSCNTCVSCG